MSRALLYARTARHLRWQQVLGRPLARVRRRRRPTATTSGYDLVQACAAVSERWTAIEHGNAVADAERVVDGRFCFLGQEESFAMPPWCAPGPGPLWTYQLHYFRYALDLAWAWRRTRDTQFAERFGILALDWIAATADGRSLGWDPYPTAVRIGTWIRALHVLGAEGLPPATRQALTASLGAQATWLEGQLEYHLLGNHLLRDYAALSLAGLALDGPAAPRWRRRFLPRFWAEFERQVLADGMYVERSPMYHAEVLADAAEIAAMQDARHEQSGPDHARRIGGMLQALGYFTRPDGSLHLFNDAANRESPSLAALQTLCGSGAPAVSGSFGLLASGYAGVIDNAAGFRLLVDCGDLGPAHQPGHGHADALSFELDLRGVPVIVDAGTGGYDGWWLRQYQRSTPAHNTVAIDGKDQAELWGTFRVARYPRVTLDSVTLDPFELRGTVQPYHATGMAHVRRIRALGREGVEMEDCVVGADGATACGFLHFHPRWQLAIDGQRVLVSSTTPGSCRVAIDFEGTQDIRAWTGSRAPIRGWYSPAFGAAVPCTTIEYRLPESAEQGVRIRIHVL